MMGEAQKLSDEESAEFTRQVGGDALRLPGRLILLRQTPRHDDLQVGEPRP